MTVLHEWIFHNRVCRVVESEPGIVHFEEASRTTGDPSVMLFNWTTSPCGAANEIIQLSMALAEAHVINRDLSASIAKWQEERNRSEREIELLRAQLERAQKAIDAYVVDEERLESEATALRARVAELEGLVPRWVQENESAILNEQGWSVSETDKIGNGPRLWLMVPSIPLPEGEG